MSKRKRTPRTPAGSEPRPEADDAADDSAVKDDMVHVTPDLLSGSPDIFAPKRSSAATPSEAPETISEPVAEAPVEPPEPGAEADASGPIEPSEPTGGASLEGGS